MSTTAEQIRQRMLQAILARATTDPAFRSGLLNEPKETISDAFGLAIPDQFRVRFIEKGANLDALIVLPDARSEGGELSEADLDVVNGGAGIIPGEVEWPW